MVYHHRQWLPIDVVKVLLGVELQGYGKPEQFHHCFKTYGTLVQAANWARAELAVSMKS